MYNSIISLSGGIDSTTLLYHLVKNKKEKVYAVIFNYGQNHSNEIKFAKYHAKKLEVDYKIINLKNYFKQVNHTSALLNGSEMIENERYSNNPKTYVPYRNLLFLIILASIAEEIKAEKICLGIQKTDTFNGYWDTSKDFVKKAQELFNLNVNNQVKIECPFVNMSKTDEIRIGLKLGLDYNKTISCYKGTNCKQCATCIEREEAFLNV